MSVPYLGPCCECGGGANVRNVVMIPQRAPKPGTGWGCVQCDLPPDGAVAVLCDKCLVALGYCKEARPLRVCAGWPADGKRMAYSDLATERFDHDLSKHPEVHCG